MDPDEMFQAKKPKGPNFEAMSVGELEAHIARLEAEIAEAREWIGRKRQGRGAAEAFFRR
ncbi:MAG: DUF1192 domain-containing protein [Alphaproteobacteria bacterium]|nr:DUF1192 domain-containing protein [Alphaproteobacteria bacterium]